MKEIYQKIEKSSTVNIVNNEIHSLRNKNISSTGLRIYKDNCIGVSGAQGSCSEAELEQKAIDMLKMQIPYPYQTEANNKITIEKKVNLPADFNLMAETQEILNAMTSAFPDFIFSYNVYLDETESRLHNENGLDLQYKDAYLAVGLIFKEKQSANIMDGYYGYAGRDYNRDIFVKEYQKILKAYSTPVSLPDVAELPIIMTTDSICVSKLNSELDGLQIGTGASLFTEHIGKDKFNKDLTIWQTHNPDDNITPFFDMEGHVNNNFRFPLIENGRILNGYTDKQIAQKYNLPYTGCASGIYDSIPKLGGADLKLKPSDKSLKQLLNGKLGVYMYISSGGDFTSSGDFATPVQLAFLTDGENLLGRLPELNISSNIFSMFGSDYIGVSKEKTYPHDFSHYLVMNMKVSKLY